MNNWDLTAQTVVGKLCKPLSKVKEKSIAQITGTNYGCVYPTFLPINKIQGNLRAEPFLPSVDLWTFYISRMRYLL